MSSSKNTLKFVLRENFEGKKLESIFFVLTVYWAMLKWPLSIAQQPTPQEEVQKFILFKQFHFGRTQLLMVRETLGISENGLL